MSRRTQSVRNRTVLSHSVTASDDLGVLREGEPSIEDVLRQELLDARREHDKLQSQVDSLNAALRARPPIERVQELEKEFQSLELLLHGTQRENERAMAELERVKNREKLMERELRKFAGDDWEDTLNMSTAFSAIPSSRATGSGAPRVSQADSSFQSTASTASITERPSTSPSSAEATLAHMEQIRTMLMGMSERLQTGEEKLQQAVDRAEQEKKKLSDIMQIETGVPA
ncbi:hypothetical protein JB92DRAFT_3112946 [Gautieria morchelliformis]|nr:hypothetical protein JB92DRAFT_3112946 [Gautieria morchelliformis]